MEGLGAGASAVAAGESEFGFTVISAFQPNRELEFLGPLPAELQTYTVYTGGVGTAAREAERGKALINYLRAPAAVPVLKAKGMEPGSP